MKIGKSALVKLNSALPKGSGEVLRKRLEVKGQLFSKQYIYRVLDPDHPDYNQIIIEEAVKLGEEIALNKKEMHQRIHSLKPAF